MGGVAINHQTQVLNEAGKAIAGLFAAGEVVGGLHGNNRIGGNSIAESVIFGPIRSTYINAFEICSVSHTGKKKITT